MLQLPKIILQQVELVSVVSSEPNTLISNTLSWLPKSFVFILLHVSMPLSLNSIFSLVTCVLNVSCTNVSDNIYCCTTGTQGAWEWGRESGHNTSHALEEEAVPWPNTWGIPCTTWSSWTTETQQELFIHFLSVSLTAAEQLTIQETLLKRHLWLVYSENTNASNWSNTLLTLFDSTFSLETKNTTCTTFKSTISGGTDTE